MAGWERHLEGRTRTRRKETNLGSLEHNHRPARFDKALSAARPALDGLDFVHAPLQSGIQFMVDFIQVIDDADLVAVAGEEAEELLVVHAAEDGALADLEAVKVQDGNDSARLGRVKILDGMPGCSGRTSLGLAIADNTGHDEVGLVHDGAEGNRESIAQLATLMDRAWGLGIDVAARGIG